MFRRMLGVALALSIGASSGCNYNCNCSHCCSVPADMATPADMMASADLAPAVCGACKTWHDCTPRLCKHQGNCVGGFCIVP
jgi:hypothetical protein